MTDPLQAFWDDILSEDSTKISDTFKSLSATEQQKVLVHLYKMTNEPGWHSAQVQTASKAIQVIEENKQS
jgi:hypothetical protein